MYEKHSTANLLGLNSLNAFSFVKDMSLLWYFVIRTQLAPTSINIPYLVMDGGDSDFMLLANMIVVCRVSINVTWFKVLS